jgi:hypothetical protein
MRQALVMQEGEANATRPVDDKRLRLLIPPTGSLQPRKWMCIAPIAKRRFVETHRDHEPKAPIGGFRILGPK